MTNAPAKSWKFTLNNPTPEEEQRLGEWETEVTRLVVGREVGESGTPHLQGMVTFKRAYRLSGLKKLMPRAWWGVCKCPQDALYEMKDGNVILNVNNKTQGKRNDLKDACDAMKEGASMHQMYKDHTEIMVKYPAGMAKAHARLTGKPMKKFHGPWQWPMITDWTRTQVLQGPPNIGKTQFAKAHFENACFVTHMDQLLGFDPEVHDGIIFDDFSCKHMPREAQIQITDMDEDRAVHCRYSCAIIPEGTRKIFTCNPGHYPFISDPAIDRRVTVTEVGEGNTDFPHDLGYKNILEEIRPEYRPPQKKIRRCKEDGTFDVVYA